MEGYYYAIFGDGESNGGAPIHSKISVPALLIANEEGGGVNLTRFDMAAEAFTGVYTFKKLRNVGYFPQIESPETTASTIVAFLKSNKL